MIQEKKSDELVVRINPKQKELLLSTADYRFAVWGRGTGKTTTIGINHYRRLLQLPQAKFFLSASTYKQILNNCLPPMIDFWKSVGLEEYDFRRKRGHYVIGVKPPPHFVKPFKPPRQYDHVITFWNGYTIEMFSMDRPSPHRGGNFDGGDADEVALIKWEHLEQNLLPTIRGNKDKYGAHHPLHGKFTGYTSMPWLSSGLWVLDMQTRAIEDPGSFFYSEATAHCNLHVLGPDWIDKMQKILTPSVFDLEILNKRKVSAENMFYHKFSEDKHVYIPTIHYKEDPTGRGISEDRMSDYDPAQLLDITWDFGGWFTCAAIFQQSHDRKESQRVTERMINSFSVNKGGSAKDVVKRICEYYSTHKMKYARIWGEPRGKNLTAYGATLYEEVVDTFTSLGWQTEMKATQPQADSHDLRFTYINDVLSETKLMPKLRINRDTCKAPIIAIQGTERTFDGKKDKSKERDRLFDQQYAPHFTDALDYYFMQKHYASSSHRPGEVWH